MPPSSQLPKAVPIVFLLLCGLAIWVTLRRGPESPDPAPSAPSTPDPVDAPLVVDAPPERAVLRETRKEGSRFDCSVTGMIEGTLKQTTSLEAYHPIFRGDIRSTWLAPWTTTFSAEVLRNDGNLIQERRTFHEVRFAELIAPAELTDLTYDLDPQINQVINRLAARLKMIHPDNPVSQAMGAIIKSQHFNYAEVARLTGIDERILREKQAAVAGAARILDAFEGKSVEVSIRDGRAEWMYAPDLPTAVSDTLGRVHTLIDYSALPAPELAVGERTVLSDLLLTEMIPPHLMSEVLGDFDIELTLNLTRTEDAGGEDRILNRFIGDGFLRLRRTDGTVSARLAVRAATLDVDVTDPTNRFVTRLELDVPVESHVLASQSRFRNVSWDGDLSMRVVYEVRLAP